MTWDYNDGSEDEKGPDNPDWEMYLGNYGVFIGGNPVARARIEKKNGYLYVSYMNQSDRLEEIEPGIFMSARGEILQFGKEITFASLFELVKTVQGRFLLSFALNNAHYYTEIEIAAITNSWMH